MNLENNKVTLAECRKILNRYGVQYTDEEILEIRDWLYHIIEIILDAQERFKDKEGFEANNETLKQAA